jgi:hypothetical protein
MNQYKLNILLGGNFFDDICDKLIKKYGNYNNISNDILVIELQNYKLIYNKINNNKSVLDINSKKNENYLTLELNEISSNDINGNVVYIINNKNKLDILNLLLQDINNILELNYITFNINLLDIDDIYKLIDIYELNNIYFWLNNKSKDYEIYKNILLDFNYNLGICSSQIEKIIFEYTINLMWIYKEKKETELVLPNKTIWEIEGRQFFDDDILRELIIKNYNDGILEFKYINTYKDEYNVNLNDFTITQDKYKYKIYKINYIDYITKWAILNPESQINLWYDSSFVTPSAIINTLKLFYIFNSKNPDAARIHLMDISTLDIFNSINSKYPYIFKDIYIKENIQKDPEGKILSKKFSINDKEGINLITPLYFRVDLLRCMIAYDLIKQNKCEYFIYSDLDLLPQSKDFILSSNIRNSLNTFGIVLGKQDSRYENSFQIFGTDNWSLKDKLIDNIYSELIIKSCELVKEYLIGECAEQFSTRREKIFQQQFYPDYAVNNCMNFLQEKVYINYKKYFFSSMFKLLDPQNVLINHATINVSNFLPPSRFAI